MGTDATRTRHDDGGDGASARARSNERVAMRKTLGLLGVPSSAGAFAPGQEKAPRALRQMGLVTDLKAAGVAVVDHGDSPLWQWQPDQTLPAAQNLKVVAAQARDRLEGARDRATGPYTAGAGWRLHD